MAFNRGLTKAQGAFGNAMAARLLLALALLLGLAVARPALALEPVVVKADEERLEIGTQAEHYSGRGDRLQIATASGPDGLAGRVEIKAQTPGTNPNWMVFALRNPTDRPLERWLVAERFTFIGSGLTFPDLDAARIVAVTPSQGFVPDRVASDRADIFQLSIEPGQTVTFAAEMASEKFPRVRLWKPFAYEATQRERELLNGILLGISGLLALFLTALFAANHKAMFPAAGAVAWAVVALLCVDFGFWHRIFRLSPEDNALYRAAAEAAVAAGLVLFLFTFLKISRWHRWIGAFWLLWMAAQAGLVVLAPLDPGLADTLARWSFVVVAGVGTLFILYLVLANQDRAWALLPVWILVLVWILAAGLAASGRLAGEFIAAGLISGLVLILAMLGFIVTQFAFRGQGTGTLGGGEAFQARNFAIEGAGLATFDWNSRRNEVQTGPLIEDVLGLPRGRLNCGLEDWLKFAAPRDQEHLREVFRDLQSKGGGMLHADLMMKGSDNSAHWFSLRGACLPQPDPGMVRCVGIMRETTRDKQAQERLLVDAIRDHRTGLPNRELLMDRLNVAIRQARISGTANRLALLLFDLAGIAGLLSEFDENSVEGGLRSMLKRLQNTLGPLDTVGRIGPDRYGILLPDTGDSNRMAKLVDQIRQTIRSPMPFGRNERILNVNLGIAYAGEEQADAASVYRDAEIALERAKRAGHDRFEVFRATMRGETDARGGDAGALRKAMEKKAIAFLYQPIYGLAPERLAGFEAMPRWQHPERGLIGLGAFMPMAVEAGFGQQLAVQLLEHAAKAAMTWQRLLPREQDALFVSIDVGHGLPVRLDSVQEVRKALTRAPLPRGLLRLECDYETIRDNPELAFEFLDRLRSIGAATVLTGYGASQLPLGYLAKMPLDGVKLDHRMCLEALTGEGRIALVRGATALAREFALSVHCDAVESRGDVGTFRAAGCNLASGPVYGEPLDDSQVAELLAGVRAAERKANPAPSVGRTIMDRLGRTGAVASGASQIAAMIQSAAASQLNGKAKPAAEAPARPATTARRAGAEAAAAHDQQRATAAVAGAVSEADRFAEELSASALAGAYAEAGLEDYDWTGAPAEPGVTPPPASAPTQRSSPPPNAPQPAAMAQASPVEMATPESQSAAARIQTARRPDDGLARSETPTILVRTPPSPPSPPSPPPAAAPAAQASTAAPGAAASGASAISVAPASDPPTGLARLQRGNFGANFGPANTKPAASALEAVPPAAAMAMALRAQQTPAAPIQAAGLPGKSPAQAPVGPAIVPAQEAAAPVQPPIAITPATSTPTYVPPTYIPPSYVPPTYVPPSAAQSYVRPPAGPPPSSYAGALSGGQAPPPAAGTPTPGFADGLPDADILRGLAARLEVALKRDRQG